MIYIRIEPAPRIDDQRRMEYRSWGLLAPASIVDLGSMAVFAMGTSAWVLFADRFVDQDEIYSAWDKP